MLERGCLGKVRCNIPTYEQMALLKEEVGSNLPSVHKKMTTQEGKYVTAPAPRTQTECDKARGPVPGTEKEVPYRAYRSRWGPDAPRWP